MITQMLMLLDEPVCILDLLQRVGINGKHAAKTAHDPEVKSGIF